MGLRPNRIIKLLCGNDEHCGAGFIAPKVLDLVPETTQVIVATKPEKQNPA